MYTRIPDCTQARAWSASLRRFLYSISHDIDIRSAPLNRPQFAATRRLSDFIFVPHSGIVYCPIEKHLEHLQQFQFPHNFDGPVHYGFALQKIPEIFLGQNNCLDHLAERYVLASPAGPNLAIPMFNIEFVFPQQPFPEMAVNLVNAFS